MRGSNTMLIVAALMSSLLAVGSRQGDFSPAQQEDEVHVATGRAGAIKVTITTGGGLFGPPKDRYRVGQRVPVVITMTNASSEPVSVCVSGTLYQDRPRLLKDGQPLPYMKDQQEQLQSAEKDEACAKLDLPESFILKPHEPTVVDWLILAEGTKPMGDLTWYEPLRAGTYELSIQRRTGCCDGPMVESNKIRFEVVP